MNKNNEMLVVNTKFSKSTGAMSVCIAQSTGDQLKSDKLHKLPKSDKLLLNLNSLKTDDEMPQSFKYCKVSKTIAVVI